MDFFSVFQNWRFLKAYVVLPARQSAAVLSAAGGNVLVERLRGGGC